MNSAEMHRNWLFPGLALLFGAFSALAAEPFDAWKPWTPEGKPDYVVKRAGERPALSGRWDSDAWKGADELHVTHVMMRDDQQKPDSDFLPTARARVLYDDQGVYVFFHVNDRYVQCEAVEYHGKVWRDACAEFFVQPKPERGYFNFEINCGGTMLLSYHENPQHASAGTDEDKSGSVPWEQARTVSIYHSMPQIVYPEIGEDVVWQLEYFIPYRLLEAYVGPLGDVKGQTWRANFYKCAESNSHPHWLAWSPLVEGRTFHAPRFFGVLRFE